MTAPIKLSELEEKAKSATQGEWIPDPRGGGCVRPLGVLLALKEKA